jgi:hypothetical protein
MYFATLREEMLERVRLVSRIELGKFVVIITGLGLTIGKDAAAGEPLAMAAVSGLLPLMVVLFDFYIAYNQKMIHRMGEYIHVNMEKGEKGFALNGVKLWEEYVSGSNQTSWDALGRIVHLGMTSVVMVISGFFFNAAIQKTVPGTGWWMVTYVSVYVLFWILDFRCLGIYQKLRGRYYV